MKIAIMQPYFFPYIGYFQLINIADEFILFDTPQFIRHGWIERNRILNQNGDPIYIRIPLQKHKRNIAIKDLKIKNSENWKEKILAQLISYKKKAPNYWEVISLIKNIFVYNYDSITQINYYSLITICDYIGIDTPIKIWSEMHIDIDEPKEPDDWALHICKALNASIYYNPIGGKSFFNPMKYKNNGILLYFLETKPTKYYQYFNSFTPFLSIIDILMFNPKDKIKEFLNEYELK